MAHPAPHHDPHDSHGVGHVVSPKILIATAAALLVLTAITVASVKLDFSALDLNELNIFLAMTIAVIKGSLVCLFFMHLRWDRPFNAIVLVAALAFVGLFISFAMTDRSEYMPDLVTGEHTVITDKLQKVPQPAEGAGGAAGGSGAAH